MSLSTLDAAALSTQIQMSTTEAIDGQAAAHTLGQLIEDVNLGNITPARKELATLTAQIHPGRETHRDTPLAGLLARLGTDLGTGNMIAAQTDVSNFIDTVRAGTLGHAAAGSAGASGP